MKSAIVTASIGCLLAGLASAQPYYGPPSAAAPPESAPPAPAPAPAPPGAPKSETTAFLLSLGGTLLPVGLMIGTASSLDSPGRYPLLATSTLVTAMFTPSIGHWYAGKIATRGLALRAAGGATALLGLGAALSECPAGKSDCTPALGLALMVIGGAVFVGGMVDDVATAARRVRRYNRDRGFGVAPIMTPDSAGLALAGQL